MTYRLRAWGGRIPGGSEGRSMTIHHHIWIVLTHHWHPQHGNVDHTCGYCRGCGWYHCNAPKEVAL